MVNEHGGDIYGRDIRLDFSANLNPLGMPESVKKAAVSAVEESGRYPDPHCRGLVRKLSAHEGISEENIVCGNGADDLIYRIVHALRPKRAVIARPTFSEYAKALREVGCEVTGCAPGEIEPALASGADMLVLCNPNNPTGQLTGCEELKRICGKCRENGIIFLCDECFIDLCETPAANSVKQFLNSNVIILKAFTKTYAMAGLRLGYALSGSPELAEKVRRSGQYWSVSAVAQAAGIAALDEREYLRKAVKIISEERKYLSAELTRCGFTVLPSDTNFILFGCGLPLDEMLLGEGILIRSFEGSDAPGDGYFRIAVKLHEENEALIYAIEKVMKWQKT